MCPFDYNMGLSSEAVNKLQTAFNDACADRDKGLPGVVGVAVGRDGKELFAHAAGKRGFGSEEPMTLDNIFWIASCTKMITGVACMQLVEQGKLSLDDAAQTESLCPEFKDLKVLQPDGHRSDVLLHSSGYQTGNLRGTSSWKMAPLFTRVIEPIFVEGPRHKVAHH